MSNNPPPANVLRCAISGTTQALYQWGSRFFISYSGTTPDTSDCEIVANKIITEWTSQFVPLTYAGIVLTAATVTDLSSDTGANYESTTSEAGTRSGSGLPDDVAMNVSFKISRRYRGGHPKIFLPLGVNGDLTDAAHWGSTFLGEVNSAWGSFMSGILAVTGLGTTLVNHVNVSFYSGYLTVGPGVNGKLKYPPKARTTALIDQVTAHDAQAEIASQRRRRVATSP